jgi:HEAT repeat protein
MIRCCLGAWCAILLLAPGTVAQEKTWSMRFPAIAQRIPHLDRRLAAEDVEIRQRALTMLITGRPRDSAAYPPFLRALLKDPSSEIRGLAMHLLWEHQVFVPRDELPASFHVAAHFIGEFRWQDPQQLERIRAMARTLDAEAGWAIRALALVHDKETLGLARAQVKSNNVFVRHCAAMALVQLGRKQEGIDLLHRITDAQDDETGYYRCRAAEDLFRLGERKAIEVLFDVMERKIRKDYMDDIPRDILEDLTGQYFLTAAEGRAWWKKNR